MVKPRVKIKKDGISTFIATLLLMVLAVSAGVVIYAYTMGYLGGFGGPQTMGAISLDTYSFVDEYNIRVYVRNIGKSTFELQSVYIDGLSVPTANFDHITIDENGVKETIITYAAGFGTTTHVVKLVGVDNTQISFNAKGTGSTGVVTYSLTINTVGSGSVAKSPNQSSYSLGASVQLTATPLAGWVFSSWSGDLTGSANPGTVIIDADPSVTATFVLGMASPTLSTTPPSGAVVGVAFTDSATLTGATANAAGTVTYTLYSGTYPSGTPVGTPSTVTVTNGVVPDSDTFTVASAGSYYFTASYSGDANNNPVPVGTYHEDFTVGMGMTSPTLSTMPPSGAVVGVAFTDSATLTGATSNAGGSVTYTLYSGTYPGTLVDSDTVAVTDGVVPNSKGFTVASAGSYYFTASYSGDANNNPVPVGTYHEDFTVNAPASVLDHFDFDTITSPKTAGTSFSITITAKDQYNAPFTSYTGTNSLTVSSGTISPTTTPAFSAGVWTGSVTLYTTGSGITIGTTGATKTGTSNGITVIAGSGTFGSSIIGTSGSSDFGNIRGSRFASTSSGTATSVTAYLTFTPSTDTLGTTGTSNNGEDIENIIRGQLYTTPTGSPVIVQSISAYIECTTNAKNMKAAIYNPDGTLVASTNEQLVGTGTSTRTFTFSSPPTLNAGTQYVLVVWSQTASGSANLRYASGTGTGRYVSQTYGSWPSVSFSTNTRNYIIYCTYTPTSYKAQTAIYSSDGSTRLGITEEKTLTAADNGWVTFNFVGTGPALSASTNYVLMAWASDDNNVDIAYNSGGVRYQGSGTYNTWPTTVSFDNTARTYSIYCTYSIP